MHGPAAYATRKGAKALGKEIEWFRDNHGTGAAGLTDPRDARRIFLNVEFPFSPYWATGHEFTHRLHNDDHELYSELAFAVHRMGPDTDMHKADAMQVGYPDDGDVLFAELVADTVGHHFTDKQFWRDVAKYSAPGRFKRLVNWVIRFLKRHLFKAKLNTPDTHEYYDNMMALRDTLAKIVAEYQRRQERGQYYGATRSTGAQIFARAKDLDQAPESVSDAVEARLKDAMGIKRKPWAERAKELATKTKHAFIFQTVVEQGYLAMTTQDLKAEAGNGMR